MALAQLPEFLSREPDGSVHLAGHRLGLEDVVFFYNEGYSPEMLLGEFPTLSLPLLHKVITFYLENEKEVEGYVRAAEAEVALHRATAVKGPGVTELRRRLAIQSDSTLPSRP